MNSLKGVAYSPISKSTSDGKCSDFIVSEKPIIEYKEVNCSLSKSISPDKKIKKSDSIQFNIKVPSRRLKKSMTWKSNLIEIIEVRSYKKFNIENTHEGPDHSQEKVNCTCSVF